MGFNQNNYYFAILTIPFFYFYFKVSDVITIHESLCPRSATRKKEVQLSCDGVQESLSTKISPDVHSIKFTDCKHIYPLRIIRPLHKASIDHILQLKNVLDDIYGNNYKVSHFIGDQPVRSRARQCLCFSSWYPCEFCFAKGTKLVTNSADKKKKKSSYPFRETLLRKKLIQLKTQEIKMPLS